MHNLLHALKTHPGVRRYGQNIGWLFLEKAFRMIVTLFVGIWVVRYLGPEHFGLLSYAQSIALVLIAITSLGLDAIIVKELIRNPHQKEALLKTAIVLKLSSAFLMLVILGVLLILFSQDALSAWLIFIVSFSSLFTCLSPIAGYFQANVSSKYVVFANVFSFSLASLLKILFISIKAPVVAFAVINLIEFVFISFFLAYFYKKITTNKLSLANIDYKLLIQLLKQAWPLAIAATLNVLLNNINQLMIKWLVGVDAVGHYVAAARLSEVWFFVGASVVGTFFPAILNAHTQDSAKYQRRLQRLFDLLVVLAIIIALPVAIYSKPITLFIYGQAFQDSANVLALHICSAVFVFMQAANHQWLVLHDLQKHSYYQSVVAIIINIALNIILVPAYEITGAAISFLISIFASAYLMLGIFKKTRPCFVLQTKALMLGFLFRRQF